MSTIVIQVSGGAELAGKLRNFSQATADLKRPLGASGLYLSKFFAGEVFASRGGVIGRRWPALNPNYAVWKAERWPGRPPLVQTGLMMRSFKSKAEKLSVKLWNEAEYFRYHQEGWGVPQRVMMRVDDQRAARVVKYIVSDIADKMRQEGLV